MGEVGQSRLGGPRGAGGTRCACSALDQRTRSRSERLVVDQGLLVIDEVETRGRVRRDCFRI